MTARCSVKNSRVEDALTLVVKKQTPAVKVITIGLTFGRFILDTKSKCQYDREVLRQKQSY